MGVKLTEAKLRKMIKQEIVKEGLKDEYKQFQTEVGEAEAGWKTRMDELGKREKTMNSITSVHTTISEILNYFKKNPVDEALGAVKKTNVKKFQRALGVLESILEDTGGWLKENK